MAVTAVQHIRRMRGGAQGQLMQGADGHIYVVKFQNNPQHTRVLANELLAARLAQAIGLTTPHAEVIEVTDWLIDNTPDLEIDFGRRRERCRAGLHFGSRFAGGLMPGQVVDYLPEDQLAEVRNLDEFAGVLALDKWTGNANGRQAVFVRKQRERRYTAHFIDFGYCFHAGEWRFEDLPLRGVYYRNLVYRELSGWESFKEWLPKIEGLSEDVLWAAVREIPYEWYQYDEPGMEALVEKLLARRGRVRDLIEAFGSSDRKPFPNWGRSLGNISQQGWNDSLRGASIEDRMNQGRVN